MNQVIPKGVEWFQDSVHRIHPTSNTVQTAQGQKVDYDCLIVASGSQSLLGEGVCSIYDAQGAVKTFQLLNSFKGGKAIFTQPSTPIKCAGAPQKIAYLAEELFTKNKVRSKTDLSFYSGLPKLFAIEKYAKSLHKVCEQRNVFVHLQHNVTAIDTEKKLVTFKTPTQENVIQSYDLLHVVPPYVFNFSMHSNIYIECQHQII